MSASQKQKLMEKLGITAEEAEELMEYDRKIDTGKERDKLEHDLTKEQEKIAKKYTSTTSAKAPTVYKFDKKERKKNATKGGIITELYEFLTKNSSFVVENAEIVNAERQISFKVGENTFDLTLIQKRKPKK